MPPSSLYGIFRCKLGGISQRIGKWTVAAAGRVLSMAEIHHFGAIRPIRPRWPLLPFNGELLDHHRRLGFVVSALRHARDLLDHVLAFGDLPEDGVLVVEVTGIDFGDEE